MGEKVTEIDAGGKKYNTFFKWLIIAMIGFGLLATVSTPSNDEDTQTQQYSD